ncbi:hypothetical protein HOA93_01090 [bacterium]|nr:hypothetical protein [bacterium]
MFLYTSSLPYGKPKEKIYKKIISPGTDEKNGGKKEENLMFLQCKIQCKITIYRSLFPTKYSL